MLRTVPSLDEAWGFPYTVLQQFDDHLIIEYPATYVVPGEGEAEPTVAEYPLVGEPATWDDVTNPLRFPYIRIGNDRYSWQQRDDARRLHITTDGFLAVARYHPVTVNGRVGGYTKQSIVPVHQPLTYERGTFTVNGVCRADQPFLGATSGVTLTMADIVLIDPVGGEHPLAHNRDDTIPVAGAPDDRDDAQPTAGLRQAPCPDAAGGGGVGNPLLPQAHRYFFHLPRHRGV